MTNLKMEVLVREIGRIITYVGNHYNTLYDPLVDLILGEAVEALQSIRAGNTKYTKIYLSLQSNYREFRSLVKGD